MFAKVKNYVISLLLFLPSAREDVGLRERMPQQWGVYPGKVKGSRMVLRLLTLPLLSPSLQ